MGDPLDSQAAGKNRSTPMISSASTPPATADDDGASSSPFPAMPAVSVTGTRLGVVGRDTG